VNFCIDIQDFFFDFSVPLYTFFDFFGRNGKFRRFFLDIFFSNFLRVFSKKQMGGRGGGEVKTENDPIFVCKQRPLLVVEVGSGLC